MTNSQILDIELHAYVDGELTEARRAEVAAWLAGHPEDAARVEAYQAQTLELRQLFDPVLDEPVPDALKAQALAPAPQRSRFLPSWSLQRIAASFALVCIGSLSGWLAHERYSRPAATAPMLAFAHQAAVAHAVFTPDVKRPVEISAEHEDQLITWLSKRLGTAVRAPRLRPLGYELIGGRLLPGNSGPVAQFMYQDASGQRLTLYVSTDRTSNRDTAFRFAQEGSVNVFYWIDGALGYAISASISKDDLARIATTVYDQYQAK
jgi:anti-sigma factor RsiW